jgi:hypothetical protein
MYKLAEAACLPMKFAARYIVVFPVITAADACCYLFIPASLQMHFVHHQVVNKD